MAWLETIPHIYAIIHVGTIVCWAAAIAAGTEFVAGKWTAGKKVLTYVVGFGFLFALGGEYLEYKYDVFRDPGVQVIQWFPARDADQQVFTISSDPVPGSVEIYENGLQEDGANFSTRGRAVTVSMKLANTDVITIKYRHKSD
jgi:hypothetical protein